MNTIQLIIIGATAQRIGTGLCTYTFSVLLESHGAAVLAPASRVYKVCMTPLRKTLESIQNLRYVVTFRRCPAYFTYRIFRVEKCAGDHEGAQ